MIRELVANRVIGDVTKRSGQETDVDVVKSGDRVGLRRRASSGTNHSRQASFQGNNVFRLNFLAPTRPQTTF